MELKKASLHMDQVKCQINTQITLEEDKNISDRNPDAAAILAQKGRILIEDIRPGKEVLSMKGKLLYEVLYAADSEENKLYRVQGEIPWEEKVRVEGMDNTDSPQVQASIEDFRSSLINSRKINVRGLVNFCVRAREIKDEEILLDIPGEENLEVKKEPYSQSVLVVDKKDLFRIKEELELPTVLPAVGEVLWSYLDLGKWEIRPLENSIGIQGDLRLFLLYESDEENPQIRSYETAIPFSGNIECPGSNSCMVEDITPLVTFSNINVKRDYDGEDRILEAEMVLEIPILLYDKREVEQIMDIYSTEKELVPEYEQARGKLIRGKYQGRIKLSEIMKIPPSGGKVLQICYVKSDAAIEESVAEKEGIQMEGILSVMVLYMADNERKKYDVMKKELPFTYEMGNLDITENCKWKITPMVEQSSGVILDENTIEIKVQISVDVMVEEEWDRRKLSSIKVNPISEESVSKTPGMVVYFPQKKENIWEIGKQYGVSLDNIRKINSLSGDEIEKGQKILLVKGN